MQKLIREALMNDRQRQQQHSVRRIVLPSGRSIEVVRFHETDQSLREGLHICPQCDSELVQPLAWSEAAEDRWELALECPNCRWTTEGQFTEDQVHGLEDKLDEGLADLLGDLRRLAHANMADHVERFVAALQRDLILPEDF
jgi:hypothetical protein